MICPVASPVVPSVWEMKGLWRLARIPLVNISFGRISKWPLFVSQCIPGWRVAPGAALNWLDLSLLGTSIPLFPNSPVILELSTINAGISLGDGHIILNLSFLLSSYSFSASSSSSSSPSSDHPSFYCNCTSSFNFPPLPSFLTSGSSSSSSSDDRKSSLEFQVWAVIFRTRCSSRILFWMGTLSKQKYTIMDFDFFSLIRKGRRFLPATTDHYRTNSRGRRSKLGGGQEQDRQYFGR